MKRPPSGEGGEGGRGIKVTSELSFLRVMGKAQQSGRGAWLSGEPFAGDPLTALTRAFEESIGVTAPLRGRAAGPSLAGTVILKQHLSF